MNFYAHSLPEQPLEQWEPLPDHLQLVARYATTFAEKFGAQDFGQVLGMWHDLGKYSTEFQSYLLTENGFEAHLETVPGRVDHSTAGAQLANRLFTNHPYGRILAYCIAGHHAGLADALSATGSSGLDQRLNRKVPLFDKAPSELLKKPELPTQPPVSLNATVAPVSFQLAFFTRMLFSCLVDADYLATEAFVSPDRAEERKVALPDLQTLETTLQRHLEQLSAGADGTVAEARAEVLNACRQAAAQPPGLYSLTVPTGGGKTLSSLAFGLTHARVHGMDRVIYAIPFTSIIEQTVGVFRDVFKEFPEDTVLEHHSSRDPDQETVVSRLVTQNWDGPVVVTTNVQLFESLFASKTSRCRKVHNICNSVIILDEVQAVPIEVLEPTLTAIRELVHNYGCTILLCTATQPAFRRTDQFSIGLPTVTEITPDTTGLFRRLKRVHISHAGTLTDDQLAETLAGHRQFLCIVNTRRHAARLFQRLQQQHGAADDVDQDGGSDTFHLSTNMCGQHRKDALDTIRKRLRQGLGCRVVSTQLIEAGVDVDFPVVYRSLAGVDSIAQAAGRCNREGRLPVGRVIVFEAADALLRGYLKTTAESASELIPGLNPADMDLLSEEIVRRYFDLHFWRHQDQWDAKEVMSCFPDPSGRVQFDFRSAATRFRWIADVSEPVFVPYDDRARSLIARLRSLQGKLHQIGQLREVVRRLQPYTINLFPQVHAALAAADIEVLNSGHSVLLNETCYDRDVGFRADHGGYHDPDSLIA